MRAKVTKSFPGVKDGEVYPKIQNEGDIIEGDLARVAVAEKWAVEVDASDAEVKEQPADNTQPTQNGAKGGRKGGKPKAEDTTKPADDGKPAVEIPHDWKTLTSDELKDLAKKLVDGEITDDDSAAAAIEAEIAKRTPKA